MCQSYSKPKVGRFLRHRVVLYTYTYMYLNTCAILQQLAELFLLLHILLSNSMILFGCKRYSNKHALHIIYTSMFSCSLLHVEIHLQVISLVAKDRYARFSEAAVKATPKLPKTLAILYYKLYSSISQVDD